MRVIVFRILAGLLVVLFGVAMAFGDIAKMPMKQRFGTVILGTVFGLYALFGSYAAERFYLLLFGGLGGGRAPDDKHAELSDSGGDLSAAERGAMDEPVEVVQMTGFDPDGEPQARRMADGRLVVVFEFMPPSWAEDAPERFDDFDQQLANAVGAPVAWDDREVFLIAEPAADAVERLRSFLGSYPR
ncbi:MAG: hypothetical protein ACRC1K_18210 [Planctomycetia bacterium]